MAIVGVKGLSWFPTVKDINMFVTVCKFHC